MTKPIELTPAELSVVRSRRLHRRLLREARAEWEARMAATPAPAPQPLPAVKPHTALKAAGKYLHARARVRGRQYGIRHFSYQDAARALGLGERLTQSAARAAIVRWYLSQPGSVPDSRGATSAG